LRFKLKTWDKQLVTSMLIVRLEYTNLVHRIKIVNIHEAKTHLSRLVEEAAKSEYGGGDLCWTSSLSAGQPVLKSADLALANAATMRVVNAKGEGVLTPREDLVVGLVATGISNREIAEQLSIKENTVKKSLLRIYDKLGVSNRVELVLYALTHRDRYKSEAAPRQTATRAVVHSVSSDSTGFGGILAEGALKTN
jgi:DNA-binding CsgD family transcriptional regulator